MPIDVAVEKGICTIVINRPERLNALDAEHYHALAEAWCRVRDDAEIRVAVVTGAGDRSFTAGADIKSVLTDPPGYDEMWLTQRDQRLDHGIEVWKPIIAAINGYCLGGGMTLMLATDIRIASENATFSFAEVKRGLIGVTSHAYRQLPHAIAMEMFLTGDSIDARSAAHWGLVNKVVPQSQLMEAAIDYARHISLNAPLAVQAAKELALRSRDADLATALRMEQMFNRVLMATEDGKEGPAAFAEKRAPQFRGK
ncbi:enoyl-CoA hydratase/isomerase family protein [Bradyrhizobium sp. LLZ17]|uniref:Enoyl-CoA hydratase/isomerase family protein n=1 Tax=Bradyrhizobium sp. LLZ17 TaxID=3239388 RepID=A0AB39XSS2_9BRAD